MAMSFAPLWRLAFRPFFLFGALFGALAMALWLAVFSGVLEYPGRLDPVLWHAHEMIFGFGGAVIVGFALTAVQNWSGLRGVHGRRLQLLFAVWVAGRALMATRLVPAGVAAAVDLGFFPLAGALLAPSLRDRELRTERVLLLYFALFFAGNLLVHLDATGLLPGFARAGTVLALDTIVILIVFMGGRVIPFFTESSIARAQPRTRLPVEILSHLSAWLFLLTQAFWPYSGASVAVAFAAAAIHAVRLGLWYVRRIRRAPLIWGLHVSYLWLVAGFALTGLVSAGSLAPPIAIHAFAVGGIGLVIHGMITRVSLGHTGRRLVPSRAVVAGYGALIAAALIRVGGPWALPERHLSFILASGGLWIVSFLIFVRVYWPYLTAPRADGRLDG
jgi:uncharacterized protein involved in response to NO